MGRRPARHRSSAKGVKGWTAFSKFATKLLEDLGHIYNPKTKAWTMSVHKLCGGIQYADVRLGIGDKTGEGNWNLFDGNHDEFPWEFLQFSEPMYPKTLAESNDMEFRRLLSDASVFLISFRDGERYALKFFFKPVMFGYENRNFMQFEVKVGTHHELGERKQLPRAEATRALKVATTHLQQLQKDAALGGTSVYAGKCV